MLFMWIPKASTSNLASASFSDTCAMANLYMYSLNFTFSIAANPDSFCSSVSVAVNEMIESRFSISTSGESKPPTAMGERLITMDGWIHKLFTKYQVVTRKPREPRNLFSLARSWSFLSVLIVRQSGLANSKNLS